MATSAGDHGACINPGQQIRPPHVSPEQVRRLLTTHYGLQPDNVKELDSYDNRVFFVQVDGPSSNPNHTDISPTGYVLKIINSIDSKSNHLEAQIAAQNQLVVHGFRCPQPVPNIDGNFYSLTDLPEQPDSKTKENGLEESTLGPFQVWLVSYVPGRLFISVPYTPSLLINAGTYLARLQTALEGLSHEALNGSGTVWNLVNVPSVRKFLFAVENDQKRRLVADVFDSFCAKVLGNPGAFSKGPVHNDFNDMNILVEPPGTDSDEYNIAGVLDFGDMMRSYYVCDVGISIMYMSLESKIVDPLLAGGYFLAGYLRHRNLSPLEWGVLKECTCARYAQSLVMGAYSRHNDPTNQYTQATSARGWDQLANMWATPRDVLYSAWRNIIYETSPNVVLPLKD